MIDVAAALPVAAHLEAPGGELLQHGGLGRGAFGQALADRVGPELERAQPVGVDVVQLP